jgi:hypothetical protein
MAWARLVETAHLLTDVVGGVSIGVAVTLGTALLLDRSVRGRLLKLHTQGLGEAGVQRADGKHRKGDHGRRDPEAVEGADRTPNRTRPLTAPTITATVIQPATVARTPVGNSSAASAPIGGPNTDAATTARRYPAIAAAGEPL